MARVAVVEAGTTRYLDLVGSLLTVGRQTDNLIVLADDPLVSRHHAMFEERDGHWWVRDLGSRNGTTVDGRSVDGSFPLVEGARVRIGRTELVMVDLAPEAEETLSARNDTGREVDELLSPREREVLTLLAAGLTDDEIASRMFISVGTVRTHLDRLRAKTGRRRRAALTSLAHELGLV